MKGTSPLDNDEIRNLGLESGPNFRWQYTPKKPPSTWKNFVHIRRFLETQDT